MTPNEKLFLRLAHTTMGVAMAMTAAWQLSHGSYVQGSASGWVSASILIMFAKVG